jgi:hypothetical protein
LWHVQVMRVRHRATGEQLMFPKILSIC